MFNSTEVSIAPMLKNYITGLAKVKAPGRFLSFSVFHLFYIIELLSEKAIGRGELAKQLHVGEGTVRTILRRLMRAGLVTTSKAGCVLTGEGMQIWGQFEKLFPNRLKFICTELTPSKFNYAFLVRRSGIRLESGIEQRDAAMVAGAIHTLVIVYQNGHLRINSVCDDVEKAFPIAARQILANLMPQEDDVIVIAGADTALKAMRGAFAASWSLLGSEVNKH